MLAPGLNLPATVDHIYSSSGEYTFKVDEASNMISESLSLSQLLILDTVKPDLVLSSLTITWSAYMSKSEMFVAPSVTVTTTPLVVVPSRYAVRVSLALATTEKVYTPLPFAVVEA